jgi:hypothetical protein
LPIVWLWNAPPPPTPAVAIVFRRAADIGRHASAPRLGQVPDPEAPVEDSP